MNNKWRERWDVIIILFAVYNCVELPIEAAYNWREGIDTAGFTSIFNHIIDSLFLVDIILNFRTTFFLGSTGEEITEKSLIVKHYLKNNFLIDLVSTIPFDLLYMSFFIDNNQNDST